MTNGDKFEASRGTENPDRLDYELLEVLKDFTSQCYFELTQSDRTRVDSWVKKLRHLIFEPTLNNHYTSCPGSNLLTDLPDTCECCVPAIIQRKFQTLLQEYNITYHGHGSGKKQRRSTAGIKSRAFFEL